MLSFVLRESQLLVDDFAAERTLQSFLVWLLQASRLEEVETVLDYFTSVGLQFERAGMISKIKSFTQSLFSIFDILFSVFVSVCFLVAALGAVYILKRMQRKIIQVYHIVLLIPYGERTKRELNELLKITL